MVGKRKACVEVASTAAATMAVVLMLERGWCKYSTQIGCVVRSA